MFRSPSGPFICLTINIQVHFHKFTHEAMLLSSSFVPATGTSRQVRTPGVQWHQSFFRLHSHGLGYMHSMIKSRVFYTQYVKCMSSVPCLPTTLPLYFIWIARNGLLIYSHHLFFVHFKVIFILKPGSSFYNKIQSDHKCYPHRLLEKFHFFLRFLRKSQSFEHSQQALT